jgi:hypothetical protein
VEFLENLQSGVAAGSDPVVRLTWPFGDDKRLRQTIGVDRGLDALVCRVLGPSWIVFVGTDPSDLEPQQLVFAFTPFRAKGRRVLVRRRLLLRVRSVHAPHSCHLSSDAPDPRRSPDAGPAFPAARFRATPRVLGDLTGCRLDARRQQSACVAMLSGELIEIRDRVVAHDRDLGSFALGRELREAL